MLEIFIIIVSSAYFIQLLLFLIGAIKSQNEKTYAINFPTVSIIIAARNEEKNIGACLNSLVDLDYPQDKMEITIVNDHSTDDTGKIIQEFTSKFKHIKTFIPEIDKYGLKGKTNAISQAIEISKSEIIFTSDADCIIPKNWIKDTLKYYDDNTGIVCGFTYLEHRTVFQGMQSLDWLFLLTIASGSFSLGIPLSCVGNNMTFRRKAYEEVGGFKNLDFSVTEDFALLQAISGKTNWKCKYPFERKNLVFSQACPTFINLFRQKKRWGTGGKKSPLLGLVLMSAGWLLSGLMFFLPFLRLTTMFIIIPLLAKILFDFIFIFIPLSYFKLLKLYKYFIFFEIYYTIYVFALPFMVFTNTKVKWKGRIY